MKRRLAAVLAADVAGYTKRMEQDSAGTVAAWQSAREEIVDPAVTKYSGRIVKFTGDGFLAEFPTVQDAVSCAISMQEELAANVLDFRIGINLGDIIDDGKDIHGEGINVAARIEALCEPGGICVSGSVHEQVRHQLKYCFNDMGKIRVKNVSDPVHVIQLLSESGAAVSDNDLSDAAGDEPYASKNPSIAVLPFANLSGEPEQEYFADGIAEDLITALSKVRSFFVIDRSSSFTFKGQLADVKEIGRRLGVRYVLEGSVRKAKDKVRVSAQLVEAETGNHV